jgi:hypothetical protein
LQCVSIEDRDHVPPIDKVRAEATVKAPTATIKVIPNTGLRIYNSLASLPKRNSLPALGTQKRAINALMSQKVPIGSEDGLPAPLNYLSAMALAPETRESIENDLDRILRKKTSASRCVEWAEPLS